MSDADFVIVHDERAVREPRKCRACGGRRGGCAVCKFTGREQPKVEDDAPCGGCRAPKKPSDRCRVCGDSR